MGTASLTWKAEHLPDGVLRLAFLGRGGIGSEGDSDGERMQDAVREVLASDGPAALVIDLSGFEYRFGDWIGAVPLVAVKMLGRGRVCVFAAGETAVALRSLWALSNFEPLIPLVEELSESLRYLSSSDERAED